MKIFTRNKHDLVAGVNKVFASDRTVKAVFIPVLGICVPNIGGLITNPLYPLPLLLINYSCFIVLAWAVWTVDVKLMIALKKQKKILNNKYYKKILLLLFTVVGFTIAISSAALSTWYYFSAENKSDYNPVIYTIILITCFSIFITSLYENFFLNGEHADTLNRIEQLNVAKTHAELVALKNQIDPHFIFNSLNTLSYLISSNPADAKLYNDTLAKVYQYILMNREKNFVLLTEEIEFMSNYFYLLKIRFANAINMTIEINDTEASELLILPISLQILLENVIKHNELNQKSTLTIHITVSSSYVLVSNQINTKTYPVPTSKVGLNNLDNRYKLLTGENIVIQNNPGLFAVKLPLINLAK